MPIRLVLPGIVAVCVLLAGCGASDSPGGSSGSASPSTSPSATPSASPSPSAPPSPSPSATPVAFPCDGAETRVAVYYSGTETPYGPASQHLFREFRQVPGCGGVIETAVTAMLVVPPEDPDYVSYWSTGVRVRSVHVSGHVAVVDLTGYTIAGADGEHVALDQLVWTVTAARPSVTRVRLRVNGGTPPSGGMDFSQYGTRADALFGRADVWILQPTQGESTGSPVRIDVYGTGYEGNVPLKVFQNGTQVLSTFVTTEMGRSSEASTTVTLPPGTYELRAYNDNGKDAHLTLWDTKTFTVT